MLTEKHVRAQAARSDRAASERDNRKPTVETSSVKKDSHQCQKIAAMPGSARWKATIEAAEALLTQAAEEMDEYWEDRSETWKESYVAEEHLQRKKRSG